MLGYVRTGHQSQNIVWESNCFNSFISTDAFYDETTIEIIDPCIEPTSFGANPTNNPPTYLYTGDDEPLTWTLNPWTVEPAGCMSLLNFECANIEGPDGFNNLCDEDGAFDQTNGNFYFTSQDIINYPPGVYPVVITGRLGSEGPDGL